MTEIKYRPDIDGLRAIAVLSVVGFHAFPNILTGGFIGVDIFFVISGFLISTIIFESLERNQFSLVEFYVRRIKRIFPALLIVLGSCFIFGWLVLFPEEYKQFGKHIASGVGFISNFTLLNESGYFDNVADTKPLLHLWSLAIEEQFYIIWPLLLVFIWKKRLNLVSVILMFALVSFAFNVTQMNYNETTAFYSPQTRFWELLLGGLLAFFKIKERNKEKNNEIKNKTLKSTILSVLGILLIGVSIFLMSKEHAFPGWWALLPTMGAALILLADSEGWINRKILANPVMVWFGLISFPLYLWHWPLLSFARIIKGVTPSELVRVSIVAISILLAFLTYQFIEKPIRFSIKNKKSLLILVPSMMVIGIIGLGGHISDGYQYRPGYIKTLMSKAASDQFMEGSQWKYLTNENCLKRYPFDTSGYSHWTCLKTTKNDPTILLLGSSYANQLYPGFVENKILKNHTVLSIGTCFVGFVGGYGKPGEPCYGDRVQKQRVFIDNIIATTKSLKYVVIDSLTQNNINYVKKFSERIKFIERFGIKVIVFTPHLKPDFSLRVCYGKFFKEASKKCSFSFSEREKKALDFKMFKDFIAKENQNVLFFDQNDLFCDEGNCSYIKDGIPLHRDGHHLSEYASIKVSELFVNWAKKHLPEILEPGT